MNNFLPIYYSGFWDVPSAFLTVYQNQLFLFWRDYFDEKLDDYPHNYKIYLVKNISLEDAFKFRAPEFTSVEFVNIPLLLENQVIGEIPTKEVVFDETKRKFVSGEIFKKFLAQ